VKYQTDIARLKEQAGRSPRLGEPTLNADVVVIRNATLLIMETDDQESDLITNGSLVIRGGVIEYAGPWVPERDTIPEDATVYEANGGEDILHALLFGNKV